MTSLFRNSYLMWNIYDLFRVSRDFKTVVEFRRAAKKNKEDIYNFAEKLKIGQNREEIESVVDLLAQHRPKNLIEIGTQRGGSAFYLSNFMPPGSKLITIDVAPRIVYEMDYHNFTRMRTRKTKEDLKIRKFGFPFSRGSSISRSWLIRFFSNENCRVIPFYTYLNPAEDAYFIYENLLKKERFDAIFYDADKSECGTKSILEAFIPYLKRSGLFVIQDINYALNSGNNGMALYWKNIDKEKFRVIGEYISNPHGKGNGIGAALKL